MDSETRLRDKQLKQSSKELLWKVDENQTLRCRVRELESENHLWKERFHAYNKARYYQPTAVEDLIQEKAALHQTVNDLTSKVDQLEKTKNDPIPEDQYVPIEKYRSLKVIKNKNAIKS